ncbi:peptidase [bacterium]|nr:peptidase [bacterium]
MSPSPALLFILVLLLLLAVLWLWNRPKKKQLPKVLPPFPQEWRKIIEAKVHFYHHLSPEQKNTFERDVQRFLQRIRITGVETDIDITDKLLVASGAVIPILSFPNWEYQNLTEVLIYPDLFSKDFDTQGDGRYVSGMVGTGVMEGKMILSKKSLHLGFDNNTDKKNVAIHEFIHLIDKADGLIDGVPSLLVNREFALPWMELMRQTIKQMGNGKSDINPYGATSIEEFFPVVSEYFFERPKLFKKKHPELFKQMDAIFKTGLL